MIMKYRTDQDPVTGKPTLLARDEKTLPFNGQSEFPVATFSASPEGFPLDVQKVAQNIADLLNHRTPLHKLSSGRHDIFYSRTASSIILRTRDTGVSAPALTIDISDKSSVADLGHAVLARMDQDFMKRICDAIVPDQALATSMQQKGPGGPGAQP